MTVLTSPAPAAATAPDAPIPAAGLMSSIRAAAFCLSEATLRWSTATGDRDEYDAWHEVECARDVLEALVLDAEASGVLARAERLLRAEEAGQ